MKITKIKEIYVNYLTKLKFVSTCSAGTREYLKKNIGSDIHERRILKEDR
jgi:hypothetical protein